MSAHEVERRLETTIDGVTAWAGEWTPQEDGSVLCWVNRSDPSPFHQRPYVTYWPPRDEVRHMVRLRCLGMTLAENEVGIQLLQEAKRFASGEATVPTLDPGGDS